MNSETDKRGVSVVIENLSKSFGERQALKAINLEIQRGEIFALMGPSGSGKSLLLRHIMGLETPDSGGIRIADCPTGEACLTASYRLSVVFQSGALLNSLTVEENVGLYFSEHRLKPKDEIRRLSHEALEKVGLDPKHLGPRIPAELSGGERKRVAIARAIITEPDLLLYDEPTSELDPASAGRIAQAIRDLNQRLSVTSIVVTHDRELAFGIADRIALISDGAILNTGVRADFENTSDPTMKQILYADYSFQTAS